MRLEIDGFGWLLLEVARICWNLMDFDECLLVAATQRHRTQDRAIRHRTGPKDIGQGHSTQDKA